MLQRAADRIRGVVPGSAASLPFYTALEEKIGTITELSAGQRQDFLAQAIQTINSSVIPAYQALVVALDGQIPLPGAGGRTGWADTASTGDERGLAASGW
jgi:uncharacterized protein (DUF885 family)